MAIKIAIASGKGGTGKTSVSVNLAEYYRSIPGNKVQLIDCDVEEPNDLLFYPSINPKSVQAILRKVPSIRKEGCTYCRKCVDYCEFNAIVVLPPIDFAEINHSLCHSCGACEVACPYNAIEGGDEKIGQVSVFDSGDGFSLFQGILTIGSAMQTMLIKELKRLVPDEATISIYDAPPGTSCPVVETVVDADYVVLVAEPTRFGLYDLQLMVELLKEINKDFGVVINKAGLGTRDIYDYLQTEKITLLGEIPFRREYASAYARGEQLFHVADEMRDVFAKISERIIHEVQIDEGVYSIKR